MSYVITCDGVINPERLMFLVDRRKQKKGFWSNYLDDVLVFNSHDAAIRQLQTLKYNNPRIMSFKDAASYVLWYELENDDWVEMGWDAHKELF